ncbi:DUF397 domain-containing protein [Streptomyces gamaensis]|uniref:DUF397 domain-containing protein n=1 Tax=Streptomyces gamaensis TaxID=1763542 RepID=A0ABW0Z7L3_9ACTN
MWRKSSYSQDHGGNCIETVLGIRDFVAVRDSKRPCHANVAVPSSAWSSFVDAIRRETFTSA